MLHEKYDGKMAKAGLMKKSISMEVCGEELPVLLTYGGGTNSAAIVCELIARGYNSPDFILFADTGAEHEYTYKHIYEVNIFLDKNGFGKIQTVRNEQPASIGGLYEYSIKNKKLPSVAYGYKKCSIIYKIDPCLKFIRENIKGRYIKIVGYDFDEERRAVNAEKSVPAKELRWYPLIDWEMGRDECVESIKNAGISQPGKSCCFMCPNKRPSDIRKMAEENPNLMQKAIDLEVSALENKTGSIVGLGRTWTWKDLIATDDMFGFTDLNRDAPCGCYDGD